MRILLLSVLLFATTASADRGALTAEAGGGLAMPFLAAPYAPDSSAMRVTAPEVWVGARYGLTNHFEVSASGFYEPTVRVYHHGVTVRQDAASYPSVVAHDVSRMGALVGGRFVHGSTWRLAAGLELGWSRRAFTSVQAIDVSNPAAPVDLGLGLADVAQHHFVIAPLAGVEWSAGDHWAVSILPRLQLQLGPSPSVAVTVPVTLSWSWYL